MADDSLEALMLFRPRIAGRRSEVDAHPGPRFASSILRLQGARPGARKRRSGSPAKGSTDVRPPGRLARRCVIKARFVPAAGKGQKAARLHLSYLERDGVERDGSPGTLYGRDDSFDPVSMRAPLDTERRQFRFIVSPEDAGEIDLRTFTRDLVAQMEKDLGRRLIWAAVNHHNTAHPHVHIVVRGLDAAGRQLRIPPRYMSEEMRWQAQHILTRELGLRSEVDIARRASAEVERESLTSLDRRLSALLQGRRLAASSLSKLPRHERTLLLLRLETLSRLGLAGRLARGALELHDGWEDVLKRLGERGDIIKRIHQLAPGDVARYRVPEPGQPLDPIEGVVRGKGLHDELTGDIFAVVETRSGETHYVRLDQRTAESLRVGQIVRVATIAEPWVKQTDHVLARLASLNSDIYDPARHLQQLTATASANPPVSPSDLVTGNVRRLERLERYQLATRLGDGRWKAPPDLVQQLESRERTHPTSRIRIEYAGADLATQAKYPGPTWLDRLSPTPPERAIWGFGAEVTKALGDRAIYLRARGLEPGSRRVAVELDASERTLLARRLAREFGCLLAEVRDGFQGTLAACPALPSGRAFVRIVNARTNELVLVPAGPQTDRLEGRLVDVSVTTEDQVSLRAARRLTRGE
jgi:type IV secretory pathway VirD2 relaxase